MADILEGVNPTLVDKINKILEAMLLLGFPMKVTEGVRTTARQQQLWALGRTVPGDIVTKVDGVTKRSKHQINLADGTGHAVDCAFEGAEPYAEGHPWALFGAMVMALGLKWGGGPEFRKAGINDRPHVELMANMT
jgi:hypothetical protein